MTVIRPNAISGITSLTAQGDAINFFKSDGTSGGLEIGGARINATGISTFTTIKVGTAQTLDASGINVTGVITATSFKGDGSTLTGVAATSNISTNAIVNSGFSTFSGGVSVTSGGVNVTGIVTATSFSGSGANLTGVAATSNISTNAIVNSGITTVAAGSASVPSISPTGDTDTGIFFPSADTIAIAEGGAEAARIDSSGRLLLGTSSARSNFFNGSDSTQIQLEGTTSTNSSVSVVSNRNDAGCPFFILGKSRGTSAGSATVVASGDKIGEISFQAADGTELVEAALIKAEVDGTPGANDMPGRLIFSTTADGAASPTEAMRINNQRELLIGTTTRTANGGVLQVSNGITFPATQSACSDANTLDDYEEGNWTPLIAFGGGVVGQSYSVQVGGYTKIGRLVMFQCRVTFSNKGTSTGQATLRTLPFNPSVSSNTNGGASLAYVSNGSANFGAASRYAVDVGSTSIVFRYASGGGSTDMANTDFNNNTDIIVIGQYIID